MQCNSLRSVRRCPIGHHAQLPCCSLLPDSLPGWLSDASSPCLRPPPHCLQRHLPLIVATCLLHPSTKRPPLTPQSPASLASRIELCPPRPPPLGAHARLPMRYERLLTDRGTSYSARQRLPPVWAQTLQIGVLLAALLATLALWTIAQAPPGVHWWQRCIGVAAKGEGKQCAPPHVQHGGCSRTAGMLAGAPGGHRRPNWPQLAHGLPGSARVGRQGAAGGAGKVIASLACAATGPAGTAAAFADPPPLPPPCPSRPPADPAL